MRRKVILILTCLLAGITIVFAQGTLNTGAERTEEYLPLLKGKRVGMVINPTSVIGDFVGFSFKFASELFAEHPKRSA